MKRVLALVTAALFAMAFTGVAAASADDVTAQGPPGPKSPIVWQGNGTSDGFCNQVFQDSSVNPGDEVWLFILTGPSGSDWSLDATFSGGQVFTDVAPSKTVGSIHFEVTTDVGSQLLSASATNGSTNSVLTVSHCTVNGEKTPPEDTGSLSVVKTVVPLPDGVTATIPTSFTAHVHCSDGETVIDQDVTFPGEGGAGTPALVDGIPFGSVCTVIEDETGFPPGTAVSYTVDGADSTGVVNVSGVTIDADHSAVEVGIENSFAAVAGEVVTVPVTPVTPVAQAVAVAPAFTG